ncbi:MAG TPA: AAA family ATPase [Longimicrobiales bacterium]
MKLKRLSLHGFKSFADRTELRFHEGITAIVGPNGCGKSNISDAIRWVLGEQRASAIRGSKMEEAIFQGTAERRGVHRAEVSLIFSNEDRRLAVPQDEIEIRRTVFREGGSEFELNRTPCRLKDIHDLFRDTGLGTNAYSVIEQRMVDAILSDRAEERRQMFEEAAGIGRYKDRRRVAQRRLEAADADLARLQDLVAEVESKVRSLARQKRRAQRYRELRARRLALEVAVAGMELAEVRELLQATARRLEELSREEPSARAALAAAEADLERLRLEAADAARTRAAAAARLEETTRRIAEREREIAIAEERRSHGERRLAQIAVEREELRARAAALEAELVALGEERGRRATELEDLRARLDAVQARLRETREALAGRRQAEEQARTEDEELRRRLAHLESTAAAAEARAVEAEARLERLRGEQEEVAAELSRLEEQGDLFTQRARELASSRESLEAERQAGAERLEAARAEESRARQALIAAEDLVNRLAKQLAAEEALARDFAGLAPATAAVLERRGELEGVLGPLAEFLDADEARAALIEGTLGSLLQVLVVRDPAAADAVRRWMEEWQGGEAGAIAMLAEADVSAARAVLDAVEFAGRPQAGPVLLGRAERIERLRAELAAAEADREARAAERDAAAQRVQEAEARYREADAALQAVELELRRTNAEEEARSAQRRRAERLREGLQRQRQTLRDAAAGSRATAEAARQERARVEQALLAQREATREASRLAAELQAAYDAVRDEEAELRVVHAQAESGLEAVERRLAAAREGLEHGRMRLAALDREEAEQREAIAQLEELKTTAGSELENLFSTRDGLAGELRALDQQAEEATAAAEGLEAQVKELRRVADDLAEERHRLELQRAEQEGADLRIRERLEAEWGRPFAQLEREAEPVEGQPEALKAELQAVTADLDRLGPVNMLAMEEYEEESRRLEFLIAQRDDLVRARDDLQAAIRQINRTARQLFMETFEQIRANFRRTFETLFEGGECDVWLADPDDPLESPIEVSASPRGKRTQRIHLLSGGERALTALSLMFAIYLVKPSPFCVLDEVDAPLDEANIGRFVSMLQQFKSETQFIVITHNPRTMGAADWIYGVTMEEPGVSSIVGVRLDEVLTGAASDA